MGFCLYYLFVTTFRSFPSSVPITLEHMPYLVGDARRVQVAAYLDHTHAIGAAGQAQRVVAWSVVDLIHQADMHDGVSALDGDGRLIAACQ